MDKLTKKLERISDINSTINKLNLMNTYVDDIQQL